jgi:hypothetical protein
MNIRKFVYKLSHWETWHYLAKYIPVAPFWFWYCLRGRSLWFFAPSNPTLTFGGFEGESKREMFSQLPPGSFPNTIYVKAGIPFGELRNMLLTNTLSYPIAAKPDVGMMGLMFRKITSESQLLQYHNVMPVDYVIQEFVPFPLEVSVFYYRFPGQTTGTITGFLKKEFLSVTGDGKSTLLQLMENYPRVQFRLDEMRSKHHDKLYMVPARNEIFYLSFALNLSRGGKLVSLEKEKDKKLLGVFDGLSNYNGNFYYGRWDIKCTSIEDLKEGKNFSILEFNGCGAEPHHIYGNGYTLLQAYRIVIQHWHVLFKIALMNRRNGVPGWSFIRGWRFLRNAKKHFKMLRRLDAATELSEFPPHSIIPQENQSLSTEAAFSPNLS